MAQDIVTVKNEKRRRKKKEEQQGKKTTTNITFGIIDISQYTNFYLPMFSIHIYINYDNNYQLFQIYFGYGNLVHWTLT